METFIITNKDNLYWTGKKFIENEIIEEENPNYQFAGFDSPEEAMIFNNVFDNQKDYNIWKCNINEQTQKNWIQSINKSIKPLHVSNIEELTELQYIGMALVGILGIIKNNKVRGFCFNYLRNKNRSIATAEKLYDNLINKNKNTKENEEYVGPVWSLLNGIIKNDIKKSSCISLYKSICDSHSTNEPLKFSIIYKAIKNFTLEEIAERISKKFTSL